MKKAMSSLLAILFLTFSFQPAGAWAAQAGKGVTEREFKVIGYYSGDLFNEPLEKLRTDQLTHVMYAFLIPKEDGTLVELEKPGQLQELVAKAHRDGTKVFIALGGWVYKNQPLAPVFETVAASPAKRTLFIENVCALVEAYELDGVELDWEHPNANTIADYESLVLELGAALDQRGKELTAALNGAWTPIQGPAAAMLITEACLERFDFINVMAYDMNDGEHSPFWLSGTSLDYWLNRGVPAEKIVLGMPLYARPSWLQYRHLVAQNPEYAYSDYAPTIPLESYYNGLNTLREKTVLALKKAGGVMLFDINEDTEDETSVLSMIGDLLSRTSHLSREELNRYVTVVLDKKELVFSEEAGLGVPFIDENNRIMMPVRKPLEAIGAKVGYDEQSRRVTVEKYGITLQIPIGKNIIMFNNREVAIDTRPLIKDGRAYIPLGACFTALGYGIEWHGDSTTVFLYQSEK